MDRLAKLYQEVIGDHYRYPRNRGKLDSPPAFKAEGFNHLCGDDVTVYVHIEDGIIEKIVTSGDGCSISQASASMMTVALKGKSVVYAQKLADAFKSMMTEHNGRSGSGRNGNNGSGRGGHRHNGSGHSGRNGHHGHGHNGHSGASAGSHSSSSHQAEPEPAEVEPVSLGDLEALRGVARFPVRIKCATLCWHTLEQILEEVKQPA